MSQEMTIPQKIQANAELVISETHEAFGVELKYNEESVKWLEQYIDSHREPMEESLIENLVSKLGSFLGECIRHEFGGEWKEVNGQWGIEFDTSNVVFPFNKTAKLFQNGLEGGDSILGFYHMIPALYNNKQLMEARAMLKKKIDSGKKEG